MKCPKCGTIMELEEYTTDFINNDDEIRLREDFWCSACNQTLTRVVQYTKTKEWTENEMPAL